MRSNTADSVARQRSFPAFAAPRKARVARLDGVREGHGDVAQADVGQQVAQRVHRRQRQHRHDLRSNMKLCYEAVQELVAW